MKKLTKIIFSCAAVAAVTAAVGTAAMAADLKAPEWAANGITGSAALDGTVTIEGYTGQAAGAEETILIFKVADGDDVTAASVKEDGQIEYINQEKVESASPFAKAITLKNGAITEAGTYVVRIGGTDGSIKEAIITVSEDNGGDEPTPGSDRKLGNVNDDTAINVLDVTAIAQHSVGSITLTGDKLQAADVTDDGSVNVLDVTDVAQYSVGVPGTKTDNIKTVADKKKLVPEN